MNDRKKSSTESSALLQVGHRYTVDDLTNNGRSASCQCIQVNQRNWSRVGYGQISTPGNEIESVFLKQNINKRGEFLRDHWEYEKLGAIVGSQIFNGIVSVPKLKYHNPALALNIFEHVDVIPFDMLLRQNDDSFNTCFSFFLEKTTSILEAMKNGSSESFTEPMPQKIRPYGSASSSINFKGFDIRNIGITKPHANSNACDKLIMFDFGRPYKAPIEEAAAKLFISIGLLNWGRPIFRFAKGPDEKLLSIALPYIAPFLEIEAIQAELDLQSRFRCGEIQGSGIVERSVKKLGINIIAKRYLDKLRQWCTNNIPTN